jgi:hypothetical protein
MFASLHCLGKCDKEKVFLNKCVKYTSGLLGMCLRHSFGIPSIPDAFLNFSSFSNFYISQVLIFFTQVPSAEYLESRPLPHHLWYLSHK